MVAPKQKPLDKVKSKIKSKLPGGKKAGGNQKDVSTAEMKEIADASVEEVFAKLHSSPNGLASGEAANRLLQYGPNSLDEKGVNPVWKFFLYFMNPLAWTMEAAALLCIILGDYVDAILVCGLLIFNAVIGFYEESKGGNAIAALKNSLAPEAFVKRDGKFVKLDASKLVPGDVIRLSIGKLVPADCKLIDEEVSCNQSALTGESEAVEKHPGDELLSGSTVVKGDATALVYATGTRTFFGKAVKLVSAASKKGHGHFQSILKKISFFCIAFIIVFVVAELIVQFAIRRKPCDGIDWQYNHKHCLPLNNILVIAIGGIPIAMPTVLSVTMAIGAYQLSKKQAFVSRLTAVEELSGMDVLCSDKTGTLTKNQLTLKEPTIFVDEVGGASFNGDTSIIHAALAAKLDNPEDAIDRVLSETVNMSELDAFTVLKHWPFDPVGKKAISKCKENSTGKTFWTCKGAPQIILKESDNKDEVGDEVSGQINELAGRGYRTIGVGYSEHEDSEGKPIWTMTALLPLYDPPRDDTAATIRMIHKYGIEVKMITGDQKAIAEETCRLLGLRDKILLPDRLGEEGDKQAVKKVGPTVEAAAGFAQVYPEHKFRIVQILQDMGHTVGMTGDGVNDAPALQQSNIGIAVDGATDAARSAAAIVLKSPGLGVIAEAILGSRKIFQRMQSYTLYSITITVRIVLTFAILTIAFDWYFPTILIAIIAFLNDISLLTLSRDNVEPSQGPDEWNLIRTFTMAIILAGFLVLSTLLFFALIDKLHFWSDWFHLRDIEDDHYKQKAVIYLMVSITGQGTVFLTRTKSFFWNTKPPHWMLLTAFIFAQTASTVIAIFGFDGYPSDGEGTGQGTDLYGCGWDWAILAWIWSVITLLLLDPIKVAAFWLLDRIPTIKRRAVSFGKKHRIGHPVYGNFHNSAHGFWPNQVVDTPGGEEVMKVAPMIEKANLADLESPWSAMTTQFRQGGAGGTDWRELRAFAKRLENEEMVDTDTEFEADSEDEDARENGDKKKGKKKVGKKKKENMHSETVPLRRNKGKGETESDEES
eukprot:TRINITY_DN2443_c0_g1_i1.p1 TRINITY_DN2443_c0_g1~~TRINITY_DN2443_c0_g1_i1.p1  ORF type:complete len:1131 (+),score=360.04 TRINITY_DN2443_c0_g1_i1:260-3394(+)